MRTYFNITNAKDVAAQIAAAAPTVINFAGAEAVTGLINGINAVFTLVRAPAPAASLILYKNGLIQTAGINYTLVGATITFTVVPLATDTIAVAFYRY